MANLFLAGSLALGAGNKLLSWFSNFVSWQGATNAHSLSSVIEERRRQGAKGQTMDKLFLAGS